HGLALGVGGGTIDVTTGNTVTQTANLAGGTQAFTKSGDGTLIFKNGNYAWGSTAVTGGILQLGASGGTATFSLNGTATIASGATLAFYAGNNSFGGTSFADAG